MVSVSCVGFDPPRPDNPPPRRTGSLSLGWAALPLIVGVDENRQRLRDCRLLKRLEYGAFFVSFVRVPPFDERVFGENPEAHATPHGASPLATALIAVASLLGAVFV